jgi:hypothetical protein
MNSNSSVIVKSGSAITAPLGVKGLSKSVLFVLLNSVAMKPHKTICENS